MFFSHDEANADISTFVRHGLGGIYARGAGRGMDSRRAVDSQAKIWALLSNSWSAISYNNAYYSYKDVS